VLAIVVAVFLDADVCEVDEIVLIIEAVLVGGDPKYALLGHEELVLVGGVGPEPDVELPVAIQKRALNVLLNHADSPLWFRVDEVDNVVQVREDLDSAALIGICRLDEPDVVDAVLERDPLFWRVSFSDLEVASGEVLHLGVLLPRREEEGGGQSGKSRVIGRSRRIAVEVVLLERADQTRLGGQTADVLEVVIYERMRASHNAAINALVLVGAVVERSEDKVALLDALFFFGNCYPVTTSLESVCHYLRVVTAVDKVKERLPLLFSWILTNFVSDC